MSNKYYSVQNKTETSADMLIYGVIGDSWFEESVTARQFVADLKALEKDFKRINVRINSPGGSVFDGLPIFNALNNSTSEIHTYNDGLCASMASLILLSGKTVHSADNSLLMLHSPMSGCQGNASDIREVLDMLDKIQESLITCITSSTGNSAEDIRTKYFDYKDHWLNADEAVAEGFVSVIEKGNKKVSNKVTNMALNDIMNEFDSLVKGHSVFNQYFQKVHDFFTPNKETDMDIKTITNACGLPENATEQEVLDWIAEHATPVAVIPPIVIEEPVAVIPPVVIDPKDQIIADQLAQITALQGAPGAKNPKAVVETDSVSTSTGFGMLAKDTIDLYKKLKQ